jgi:hypothetical protein
MATIEGQSIYVGQIVKKVTSTTNVGADGPIFELNHKDKVTVAVRNVSGPNISGVKLMRVFSDGVASEESAASGSFAANDGPTFAVTYNIPKFQVQYNLDSPGTSVVLIEVEGGVGA